MWGRDIKRHNKQPIRTLHLKKKTAIQRVIISSLFVSAFIITEITWGNQMAKSKANKSEIRKKKYN